MSVFDPSPTLEAFLAAEVRNVDNGGDTPVTLATARDSLIQMDQETLSGLNPGIAALGADRDALLREMDVLIGRHGPAYEVEERIDQDAGR